jgi:hypothetical protein
MDPVACTNRDLSPLCHAQIGRTYNTRIALHTEADIGDTLSVDSQ